MPTIQWACPKCAAPANKHGKGGDEACRDRNHGSSDCAGFLCMCDDEGSPHHGESFADPCTEATCYHCGWRGTFPVKPKGLAKWEKTALDAGWTMPPARAKELGIK